MKKKLMYFAILFVLVLFPFFASADMTHLKFIFNNDNIVVGGNLNISFVLDSFNASLNDFSLSYDASYLEFLERNVRITSNGIVVYGMNYDNSEFVNNDNVSFVKNNGIVFLSFKDIGKPGIMDGDNAVKVSLNFKTLKDGDISVNLKSSDGFVNTMVFANVIKPDCDECQKQNAKNECNCVNDKDLCVKEKSSNINNDIFLYISLGFNILFIVIITILITKKNNNKKEV